MGTKGLISGDAAKLNDATRKNQFSLETSALGLPANYNTMTGKPGLLPLSASILLNAGVTLPAGFEANTYVGAFGTTDWTTGWTNFDPQNADY
jgi:hypothetical protein